LADDVLNKLLSSKKVSKTINDVDAVLLSEMNEMIAEFAGKI
jgi:hypothetical protein